MNSQSSVRGDDIAEAHKTMTGTVGARGDSRNQLTRSLFSKEFLHSTQNSSQFNHETHHSFNPSTANCSVRITPSNYRTMSQHDINVLKTKTLELPVNETEALF